MRLFKYRPLSNPEFALDILINQRLFCSTYSNLNDPFEGVFISIHRLTPEQRQYGILPFIKLPEEIRSASSVSDFHPGLIDNIRICSLSSSVEDVRLWSYYGDGHKGIAIEIDCDDLNADIRKVQYQKTLPEHTLTLLTIPAPIEALTNKTTHWEYEAEYRIFHSESFIDIRDRIKRIFLGTRVSDTNRRLLEKIAPVGAEIVETTLDPHRVCIKKKT